MSHRGEKLPTYDPKDIYQRAEPVDFDFDQEIDDSPSEIEDDEFRQQIEQSLQLLTPKEQVAVRLYFGFDGPTKTGRQIGDHFNVGKQRAYQILRQALRKLRHPSRSENLQPYFIDEDHNESNNG